VGYNAVTDNTSLSSFIQLLLPRKSAKSSKNSPKIQAHQRSLTNRKLHYRMCFWLTPTSY